MNSIEVPEIISSKNANILIQDDEYQLELNLYNNSFIEFKTKSTSPTSSCYYKEKYTLEQIKKISYLICDEIKDVFNYFKKSLIIKK